MPPIEGDGAWHIRIELIDPDGEIFNKTFQSIPTTRKLTEKENPSEIIDLDHFHDPRSMTQSLARRLGDEGGGGGSAVAEPWWWGWRASAVGVEVATREMVVRVVCDCYGDEVGGVHRLLVADGWEMAVVRYGGDWPESGRKNRRRRKS
ncbi:hypothetical protein Tco_0747872 [Tanacetum coccineum]|uniref:Uncharacterized protein n=1 Tax=Tanacetum coccineum TaxID=301880 RepID=A0ABQ4YWH8_9ASTR